MKEYRDNLSPVFHYWKLYLKLMTEQLGTCTEASIYSEHVLKKAQKMIKEANKMREKVLKAYEKYKGASLPPEKEVHEIQSIVRRYEELLGKAKDLEPLTMTTLLEYAQELEAEFDALVKDGEQTRATFFMRNKGGKVVISSHMIVGNIKENLKIVTNNSTEKKENKIAKSKVSVGEMLALDIKPVEDWLYPNQDIVRNEDKSPKLKIRPIKFDRMGKIETAISASEILPAGTEMECHLRIRKDSPLNDEKVLSSIFEMGKNNGLGQWRGSGHKGAYYYRLDKVSYDPTPIPDGWN